LRFAPIATTPSASSAYRAEINRARARRFREAPVKRSSFSPQETAGRRVLDARRIANRQRMLENLQRASSIAS